MYLRRLTTIPILTTPTTNKTHYPRPIEEQVGRSQTSNREPWKPILLTTTPLGQRLFVLPEENRFKEIFKLQKILAIIAEDTLSCQSRIFIYLSNLSQGTSYKSYLESSKMIYNVKLIYK